MSLWYRIVKNIPKAENCIKPIEYSPKLNTVYLKFTYCNDELLLKINETLPSKQYIPTFEITFGII